MPDLRGLTLARVFGRYELKIPGEVWVTFPSETLTATVEEQYVAGATVPKHVVTYVIPDRRLRLETAATEHYVVAEQSVDPGVSLTSGMSVELTAGPGWSETERWPFEGHVDEVAADGATPCFECHEESACADCHVSMELGRHE